MVTRGEVNEAGRNMPKFLSGSSQPKIIDLFAGVGGLSLGASRAGFNVVGAVERDPIARETHAINFPNSLHIADEINDGFCGEALLRRLGLKPGELYGLIGGPPCQGFSVIGKKSVEDERNVAFVHFFRLVAETKPLFYLAENVPGILNNNYANLLKAALAFVPEGYVILPPFKARASNYGAPTSRERVFFVGYRSDAVSPLVNTDFAPSADIEQITVGEALKGLPVDINPNWQREKDAWCGVEHPCSVPTAFRDRLKGTVPYGVGSSEYLTKLKDGLVSACFGTRHDPVVAQRYGKLASGEKDKVSKSVRLDSARFCPTIRAGTDRDKGRFQAVRPIHPTQARVITPREAARLQGFPDWFAFHPTKWHSFRQIGNSVSPILAEHLLRVIRCHVFP